MPNYNVSDTTYGPDTLANIAAELEVAIDAIDNAKTIRLLQVFPTGGGLYEAVMLVDA